MIEKAAAEQLPQILLRDDRQITFPDRELSFGNAYFIISHQEQRATLLPTFAFPFSFLSSARERGDCNVVCHERPALPKRS